MTTMINNLKDWMNENRLVLIKVFKKEDNFESWARIISVDDKKNNIIIYNDDKKQTQIINLTEIVEIVPSKK